MACKSLNIKKKTIFKSKQKQFDDEIKSNSQKTFPN